MNKGIVLSMKGYTFFIDGTYRANGPLFKENPEHLSFWKIEKGEVLWRHRKCESWLDWDAFADDKNKNLDVRDKLLTFEVDVENAILGVDE